MKKCQELDINKDKETIEKKMTKIIYQRYLE